MSPQVCLLCSASVSFGLGLVACILLEVRLKVGSHLGVGNMAVVGAKLKVLRGGNGCPRSVFCDRRSTENAKGSGRERQTAQH